MRRCPKSMLFYIFCTWMFSAGYFLGFLQNSDWSIESRNAGISLENINAEPKRSKVSAVFMVVIFSAPSNHERRKVVRQTWLLTKENSGIHHFFVIGAGSLSSSRVNALHEEQKEFGDLLILDSFRDSFMKLSGKLLEVFRWLDRFTEFTFLLKVDDDSFVRLDALYAQMQNQSKTRLYWGFFDGQAKVKITGKWKEQNWFLCDRYLPYAKGGGYIITSDLVHQLVLVSDYLTLYQNEDVSLGTWLAPFEIKRHHDILFDTEYMSRGCSDLYLVTHKQSTSMMVSKYKSLMQSGQMCVFEYKDRNSYRYNWNVPPSLCCVRNDSRLP